MSTLTLTTQPFTCPSCVATIERALGRAPGVRDVRVRFATNQVLVEHNAEAISAEEIAWTVTRLGYPVLSTVRQPLAA